jgi:hypothetical protein
MDLDRLERAPRIVVPALAALAALALLELAAYFGFHESSSERNAFGFSRGASFAVEGSFVTIGAAASRRFWTQRYPRAKPPGWRRIMVVGDSATRGATLEDSLTGSLHRQLNERCAAPTEVWNLSSPGYGSRRKHVVVEKALEYQPDLIIYHAGVTTEYEDSREWERYTEYHSWHPRHWVDHLPFLGRVRLSKVEKLYWEWLPEDVRAASSEDPLEVRLAAMASKMDSPYWMPKMLANLDRTVAAVRQAGVPILILTHAAYDPASGRMSDEGLDKAIAERYAGRPGVMVASNRELFSSRPDVPTLFYDTAHWTSEGMDVVARALGDSVVRLFDGACAARG